MCLQPPAFSLHEMYSRSKQTPETWSISLQDSFVIWSEWWLIWWYRNMNNSGSKKARSGSCVFSTALQKSSRTFMKAWELSSLTVHQGMWSWMHVVVSARICVKSALILNAPPNTAEFAWFCVRLCDREIAESWRDWIHRLRDEITIRVEFV